MAFATHGYELYQYLTDKIVLGIVHRFGDEHKEAAERIANIVCDDLIQEWGGMAFYLPKAVSAKCSPRNEQIFSEFNGANFGALARKYDLSDMRIRQIIRMMQVKAKLKGRV